MSAPRIVVAGAGPVGLAFAAAAADCAVRVIEAAGPGDASGNEFDLRVYAISPGSREFLREIGAWGRLDGTRIAAVRRMEVFGDQGSRLDFDGSTRTPLAWIVEAGRLAQALEQAAGERGVEVLRHSALGGCAASAAGSWVELASGERLEAELIVGADGAQSPLRRALGLPAHESPYGESAVVAHFETERAHGGIARQWFRAEGVLAWLPLPGRRISIVWSAPEPVATTLAALTAEALATRVEEAGGGCLGALRLISATGRFALRLIRVPRTVVAGAALIGDAAHAVHPLAGQGVNLGFQDARELARAIRERSPLERPGELSVLRRYERARREDVSAMLALTDGLDRLFAMPGRLPAMARNLGLDLAGRIPGMSRALAARAMR